MGFSLLCLIIMWCSYDVLLEFNVKFDQDGNKSQWLDNPLQAASLNPYWAQWRNGASTDRLTAKTNPILENSDAKRNTHITSFSSESPPVSLATITSRSPKSLLLHSPALSALFPVNNTSNQRMCLWTWGIRKRCDIIDSGRGIEKKRISLSELSGEP